VLKKQAQTALTFDTVRMAEVFLSNYQRQIFSLGQPLVMDFAGHNLLLKVHSLINITTGSPRKESAAEWGALLPKTEVRFSRAPDSLIKLVGEAQINTNAIIQPDFKFEDMGIGGLDKEFWLIFRRAFASRIYPQDLVQKLGIRHVKGLVLYGPPGTGKTLMARQIAKMLHAREPKIINGPEILNKYVGQSEENIRALFKDAEAEYKAKGDNSELHIIIFDELDAICKQRGGRNDGTGVGDSVVNQLLAKMDGVEQLNNILVIGMTNRLDMLDEALLRPGRFEVQLEIGLPNKEGRCQILKIHTNTVSKGFD
jgi:vesicle-fusing ATPase